MTAWRSLQRRGGDGPDYVKSRVLRLAQPTFPLFCFYVVAIGAGLLLINLTGALAFEVLDGVFVGAGSPLWFIAAYALCQALVPFLARLHDGRAEAHGAGAADRRDRSSTSLHYSTAALGITSYWLGLLNLLFVWPLVQQIGFWYADGFFDRAVVAAGADLARRGRDAVAADRVRPVRRQHARQPEPADPAAGVPRPVAGGVPAAAEAPARRR